MSRTIGIFTNSTERNSESDVCRLCRKNHYYFCNLFTSNVEYEISVKHVLHDLVGLQVDEGDGLPTTICSPCLRKLKDFSLFKKTCLESDTELRKISSRNNCGQSIKGEGAAKDEPGSSLETKDCIRDASEDTSSVPCSVQVTEIYIPVPECEPPLDNMLFNMKVENEDQLGKGDYPVIYTPNTAENSDNAPDPLATDDLGDLGIYRSSHVKEDQISDNEGGCVDNDFTDGTSSKLANEASSDQILLQAQASTSSHGKEMEVESSGAMLTDLNWKLIGAKKEPSPKDNAEPTFMEDGEPIKGITMAHESTTEALGFLAAKGLPIGATSTSYLSAEGNVMNHSIDECIDPTSLVRQIDSKVGASQFGIERNLIDEDLEICGTLDTNKKTNSSIPDYRQCNTKYIESLRSKGGGATLTFVGDRGGRDASNTTHNLRSIIIRGNDTSGCEIVMGDNEEINNCLIKNPENSCKSNESSYHCFNCGDVFNNKNDLIKHMKIHLNGDNLDAEEKSSVGGDVSLKNLQSSGSSYSSCEPTTSKTLNRGPRDRLGLRKKGNRPLKETTGRKGDEKKMRRVRRSITVEEKSTLQSSSSKSSCDRNLCNRVGVRRKEESYSCIVCTLSFPRRKDLTKHKRIHMAETSYSCNECKKSFVNKSHLVRHLRTHTEGRPYICDVCSYSSSHKHSLVKHMRRHTGERPFSCRICKKSFTRKCTLKTHIRLHTGEKPYECSICKKSFTDKSSLRSHMRTHTGEKPHSCSICNRSFTCSSNLKSHLRTHTGEKPFMYNVCSRSFNGIGHMNGHECVGTGEMPNTCQICQKSFTYGSALKTHMRTHTGEKPYACRMCEKSFSDKCNLKIHIRTHTGERPYSCYHCEKSFSAKTDLVKHVRIHTGEKPYACNMCSKSFSCSKERVRHLRTHTGEKPYECSICKKSFAAKGALRMHIRTHTGEKPHSCRICERSFACSGNLICHMRTHTGEKPFKCNVCSRCFAQGSSLKVHMRVHTGEKPYSCQTCKKSFARSSSLSIHMRLHTGEKPYQCDICCKSFAANSHLSRHMGVHK
ncbi:zinc finger protein 271-like isoform X1 [Ischnura elegans]|uniref:zinc finger protein 271-like isoform X1 n=1 Tax=Ischnura elegans TaxID=197161 RepID=UPI001ED87B44|nr:zinc finger protein 271-like isoform X1 [Ischnura elegans]